jgi:hypothetical protein
MKNRLTVQIEDYNMVSFIPLNIRDDDSINYVLSNIDNAIQYGEDVEPKVCGCVIAADGIA